MLRAAVCGGRVRVNERGALAVLHHLRDKVWPEDVEIGEGAAEGYDSVAHRFAVNTRTTHTRIPVNNRLDGDQSDAPKHRNGRILDWLLDSKRRWPVLIAFDGGPGTRDMLDRAHRAGVEVLDVEFTSNQFFIWRLPAPKSGGKAELVGQGAF